MKQLSLKQAIKLKCIDCNYDPQDIGNWSQQVESCTSTDCSLWQHRPLTGKTKRLQRESKLAMLTPEQREIAEMRSEISRENMLKLHSKASGRGTESVRIN